jgi:hypothetical protein
VGHAGQPGQADVEPDDALYQAGVAVHQQRPGDVSDAMRPIVGRLLDRWKGLLLVALNWLDSARFHMLMVLVVLDGRSVPFAGPARPGTDTTVTAAATR